MDWARAIERNSQALGEVAAAIFTLLATADGATRISHQLHRAVLRMLHPAEAALRRLIVIVARGLVVKLKPSRPMPVLPIRRSTARRPTFRLFDPRKSYSFEPCGNGPRFAPRAHVFEPDPRIIALCRALEPSLPQPSLPDDGLVPVHRLALRLEALKFALADLPRQARRLVRLRARRATNLKLSWRSPLRPGPPPGCRKTPVLDADFVLKECHALAHDALAPDTS